jgi:hypothetical protein
MICDCEKAKELIARVSDYRSKSQLSLSPSMNAFRELERREKEEKGRE